MSKPVKASTNPNPDQRPGHWQKVIPEKGPAPRLAPLPAKRKSAPKGK